MRKTVVIHPFLIAIFPVFSLWSQNVDLVSFYVVWPPILIVLGFTLLLLLLSIAFLRDSEKAGIVVSLFLILFFSYGGTYGMISKILQDLIIFVVGSWIVIKTLNTVPTRYFNTLAIVLVSFPLIQIGIYELGTTSVWEEGTNATEKNTVDLNKTDVLPDIYYIILDGYAREDVLRELYNYDNDEFINYLTKKGFYIANKSRSNYCQTYLSLASSLNLQYINHLGDRYGIESNNRRPLARMIINNKVHGFLKQRGYVFVAFSSGYSGTEMTNADVYMKSQLELSEFDNTLITLTPIPDVTKFLGGIFPNPQLDIQYLLHRKRVVYTFDHLPDATKIDAPVFVFAHIMPPHPPFVFGQHGEGINSNGEFSLADGSHYMNRSSRDYYRERYRDQLIFVNKKIETTVDEILLKSDRPTIIILQSDHGPGSMLNWNKPDETNMKERMSILNAIYLPEIRDNEKVFYESITPVNTFRVIFNRYFSADYELLDDRSYFSTWAHPYNFTLVHTE